ncbi:DNA mismatch repair protein MutS [Bacillus sp. FSL W7-1360]
MGQQAQTPMMKQYLKIKSQHEDAFLFFRLGDFYELFYEDAKRAASELEITLTSRGKGEDAIPMCGVPHHSADGYMATLIEKGYKIAICEQVENPKSVKGVVKREVTKVLTPGTWMNDKQIGAKENHYIVSVALDKTKAYGLLRCDVSTGEVSVTPGAGDWDELYEEIVASRAREAILPPDFPARLQEQLQKQAHVVVSIEEKAEKIAAYDALIAHIDEPVLHAAFARLLHYLLATEKQALNHLQQVVYVPADAYLKMDEHAKRNLELTETLRDKKKRGSLLFVLDQTMTAMGGRLLRKWLERPLMRQSTIEARQQMVQLFLDHYFEREALRDALKEVYDIERLAARVSCGHVNARELVQLKRSLMKIPELQQQAARIDGSFLTRWFGEVESFQTLVTLLDSSISEDAPTSVTDGGLIVTGFSEKLDQYRAASRDGKKWISALEQKEREQTGIRSLKVGYNKVFGYYIEVTRANTHLIPEGRYERKQTLTNAERYVTPELKEKEALILGAEEKMVELEYELFTNVRKEVAEYVPHLQRFAHHVSEMDVLASFAVVAEANQYVCPHLNDTRDVTIEGGRHPVVETVIQRGSYVQNDIDLTGSRDMLLITGPNMGGKSTYMRQLALTVVMTQIGSFVPATSAALPIFDQIFTRIGAADDLASGQSTFMVEMLETKDALMKATKQSLIILDEIGRGTSTYDGMALAQAIIEYIDEHIGAKTLFSTHYHELTTLAESLPTLRNVHVAVAEKDEDVVFLHQVIEGAADRSYGVYVAKLAGLPDAVTERARTLLQTFEQPVLATKEVAAVTEEVAEYTPVQLPLFQTDEVAERKEKRAVKAGEKAVLDEMSDVDLLHVTPFQALERIHAWQKQLKKYRK